MSEFFKNKSILVTGGTGTIGSEIVREVLKYKPEVVRIFGNSGEGLFYLGQELSEYPNTRYLVGDIRDKERLEMAMENINIVFHAAALKHVGACEYNPFEAVKTNVIGTQNIIEAAWAQKVDAIVNISTDKACNPTSTLGTTKLLAERLITATIDYDGFKKTIFSSVRFGNVFGSSGSVVPLFRQQIKDGGPVTITDKNMTRFIMTVPEAVKLVLKAAEMARGSEIFILRMPVLRIIDLAQVMIEELAPEYGHRHNQIEIKIIGAGAGEKLNEELMTEQECLKAEETEEMYIIYPSSDKKPIAKKLIKRPVSSVLTPLTKEEIRTYFKSYF